MGDVIPMDLKQYAVMLRDAKNEAAPTASFLRMDKSGAWVMGIEQEPIDEDTEFAVNPQGFGKGWIAWGKSERLGELFVPFNQVLPDPGPTPEGARPWEKQFGMHLREVNGGWGGSELIYRSSSTGGKRAILGLMSEVGERMCEEDPAFVPIITLERDSYKHKEYGKIYVPVLNVVRWTTMDVPKEEKKAAPAKKVAAKKGRR